MMHCPKCGIKPSRIRKEWVPTEQIMCMDCHVLGSLIRDEPKPVEHGKVEEPSFRGDEDSTRAEKDTGPVLPKRSRTR